MKVLIRRAGRRDLKAIQPLWLSLRELQAKTDPRFTPSRGGAEIVRRHREVILADPRTAFFVAEEQGKVLAFLHAQIESNDPTYEPSKYGVIIDLIVRENRRRQGIGSRLVEACKEWFASHALTEYRVSMLARNPDAQRFFEAHAAVALLLTHTAPID